MIVCLIAAIAVGMLAAGAAFGQGFDLFVTNPLDECTTQNFPNVPCNLPVAGETAPRNTDLQVLFAVYPDAGVPLEAYFIYWQLIDSAGDQVLAGVDFPKATYTVQDIDVSGPIEAGGGRDILQAEACPLAAGC